MHDFENTARERIGPDWLWAIVDRLHELGEHGQPSEEGAKKALYCWCLAMEIEYLPIPHVQVVNRKLIRLVWGEGPRMVRLECRERNFLLEATHAGHGCHGKFTDLRWVERCRRAMRWVCPDGAGGCPVGALFKEIERP